MIDQGTKNREKNFKKSQGSKDDRKKKLAAVHLDAN